jgi:hypothetical protein
MTILTCANGLGGGANRILGFSRGSNGYDARLKQIGTQGSALETATKGAAIVSSHPSDFGVTARYNNFLFTPISEQENGMQLSVLSALARANVDPWEEAARLEAMTPGDAEWALVETLSKVPGRTWDLSEAEKIATRLVGLLQYATRSPSSTRVETTKDGARLINYWLMWLGFIIAMSLSQPRHHITTTNPGAAVPNSSAGVVPTSDTSNGLSPRAGGQAR